jgi:heterotetrameric sarcosine oxidase gamma subunit
MGHLDFLSPDLAAADAVWRSPLERALAHAPTGIEDLSRTGVLEVRGELDGLAEGGGEVVRLTPERALVLCPFEEAGRLRARLAGAGRLVVDLSAGWAGLRVEGETLLRRLTDLDLDALPAMGALAHVHALVVRDEGESFRVYFPQEYGHSVAEAVIDAAEGLAQG